MVEGAAAAARAKWAEARTRFHVASEGANREARDLLKEALALDPGFARAKGHLSYAYVRDYLYDWPTDVADPLARADELAAAALAADPGDYDNHWSLGIVRLHQEGRVAEAERLYREARQLCPDDDPALPTLLAEMVEAMLASGGREREAVVQAEDAIRRQRAAGEAVPAWFVWNLGYARLAAGDVRGAVDALESARGSERSPLLLLDLAVAYHRLADPADDDRIRELVRTCAAERACNADIAGRQSFAATLPREEILGLLRQFGLP